MKKAFCLFVFFVSIFTANAEDGYRLWLRYNLIDNQQLLNSYRNTITSINLPGNSATLVAAKDELLGGLEGLLGKKNPLQNTVATGQLVIGTPKSSPAIAGLSLNQQLSKAGDEGFVIVTT
ncbi:MAG: Alpha-glucuronidase, partial [Segetibacter sp.]|nr:Alpha-glucuronidase [Segetibacter sp.]